MSRVEFLTTRVQSLANVWGKWRPQFKETCFCFFEKAFEISIKVIVYDVKKKERVRAKTTMGCFLLLTFGNDIRIVPDTEQISALCLLDLSAAFGIVEK